MELNLMGIDPGKRGGIAVWWSQFNEYEAQALPESAVDMSGLIADYVYGEKSVPPGHTIGSRIGWYIYLENVPAFVGRNIPGSRGFTLGKQCGLVEGVIVGLGIPLIKVSPQKWMKVVGTGKRAKRSDSVWKGHLLNMAKEMFPGVKVTKSTADALLVLRYAMLQEVKK